MSDEYYNFIQKNETNDPVLLDQTDQSNQIILSKASDYKVSIVKFNLPNQIETFIIDNDTDYSIQYSMNTNQNNCSAYVTPSFSQPLYQSSAYPMRSINDFVENFNRSSLLAFKGLLNELNPYYGNVVSRSVSGTNSSTTAQRDLTFDFTTGLPSTLYCSYIVVQANVRGTSNQQNFEIQLIDPNGLKCIVAGSEQYSNKTVTYEDGSANNLNTSTNLSLNNYQPIEAFAKLCASPANQNGNWTVRLVNRNSSAAQSFNVSFNVTVTLYFSPVATNQSMFPRFSPTLNLNGDSFELIYDDNLPRTSFQIAVSPRLDQILSFPSVYDSVNGRYLIKLPQTRISDSLVLTPVVYKQPLPTAYKAIDIAVIEIRSKDLPVSGERSVITSDSIISSIDVAVDDLNNSVYQYVNSMLEDRSYDLRSDIPLQKINISVFVRYRSNNRVVQAYLPKYTSFNMLLKFIHKNKDKVNRMRSNVSTGYDYANSYFN